VTPQAGSFSFMLSKDGYCQRRCCETVATVPDVLCTVASGQAAAWGPGHEGPPSIRVNRSPIEPTCSWSTYDVGRTVRLLRL
jgi:hypothetical protein